MSSYTAGYESYWCGVAYDPWAIWDWRKGWLDAEEDEYFSYW